MQVVAVRQLVFCGLVSLACLRLASPAIAALPEPDAIFYGKVTVAGVAVTMGTAEARNLSGESLASGALVPSGPESLFALQVPIVHLLPGESSPPSGTIVLNDSIQIFFNGSLAMAPPPVSVRGNVTETDLVLAGSSFQLFGEGQGGSLSLSVSGNPISVTTFPQDSPADAVAAVAAEINATLQGQGIWANAEGDQLVTNGDISSV